MMLIDFQIILPVQNDASGAGTAGTLVLFQIILNVTEFEGRRPGLRQIGLDCQCSDTIIKILIQREKVIVQIFISAAALPVPI